MSRSKKVATRAGYLLVITASFMISRWAQALGGGSRRGAGWAKAAAPAAPAPLVQTDPELVLVVHRPPADDGPLREHLSQCRIDALAAGQRAVLDRILKARSHHGRVVRHGDDEPQCQRRYEGIPDFRPR